MCDDLRSAGLGFGQHLGNAFFGVDQTMAAFLARGESVSNLLLAYFDRAHQRRPNEFRREQDEGKKRDRLHQQRQVDVHDWSSVPFVAESDLRPIISAPLE